MQEEGQLFLVFRWMAMVRNEKGGSYWSSQATIETSFGGVNEKRRIILE